MSSIDLDFLEWWSVTEQQIPDNEPQRSIARAAYFAAYFAATERAARIAEEHAKEAAQLPSKNRCVACCRAVARDIRGEG